MAQTNKIKTAGKEDVVRRLAAKGMSSTQISDALVAQGLKVGRSAVSRFLREETEDRRDAARHVAASEAKESIPLATKAVRQVLIMNLSLVQKVYDEATSKDLTHRKTTPQSVALAVTAYSKATTAAARALHHMTVGDDAPDEALRKLTRRVSEIMASSKDLDDSDEAESAPSLH